jgi:hypothetical protein
MVAYFCVIIAWFALLIGGLLTASGCIDLANLHPSGPNALLPGVSLLFASLLLFALGRIIVLLAQIAANGRAK